VVPPLLFKKVNTTTTTGEQDGDGTATISPEKQRAQTAAAMLELVE